MNAIHIDEYLTTNSSIDQWIRNWNGKWLYYHMNDAEMNELCTSEKAATIFNSFIDIYHSNHSIDWLKLAIDPQLSWLCAHKL